MDLTTTLMVGIPTLTIGLLAGGAVGGLVMLYLTKYRQDILDRFL